MILISVLESKTSTKALSMFNTNENQTFRFDVLGTQHLSNSVHCSLSTLLMQSNSNTSFAHTLTPYKGYLEYDSPVGISSTRLKKPEDIDLNL